MFSYPRLVEKSFVVRLRIHQGLLVLSEPAPNLSASVVLTLYDTLKLRRASNICG